MAFTQHNPPSYDIADTVYSTLTPYLTLPHLLSLTWLAYPILSLVFVAFRLTSSLDSTQNAIASAKGDLLASCKAAEEAATSAASMPRYMALATNEQFADAVNASLRGARQALTLSLTVMQAIIEFIVDLYRSIFLCFLELVVRGGLAILIGAVEELNSALEAVGNTLRERIQTDIGGINTLIRNTIDGINRALPFGLGRIEVPQFPVPDLDGLANVQIPSSFQESLVQLNQTIPTVSTIKEKLNDIIGTPFELLRADINETFSAISFNGSALPVPEQNKIAFCDKLDMKIVDDIGNDILKTFKIGIVILIVIALLLVGLNCLLTWYKWRCMKGHLEYTRQAWNTDPTMVHTKGGSISSAPQVTLSDHNLMVLNANSEHPLITRILNQISQRLNLSPKHHTNLQWFFNYIFHPPAAACLLIGVFGLLLIEVQLLAMGPMINKYQGQAAETARDFSNLIATSINDSMFSQSRAYAAEVNLRVDTVQTTINDGVFGWVDVTTTQINTTINEFYDDLQEGVSRVFGNTILATPATEFIRCLIGSKVDAIENALTFLHDNLNVDMPRVNENVLILSPESVNEASAPIAAAALGGGGGESDDGGLVGRLVNSYANSLRKERITFAIFLALWGIVVLMGLLIIFWHSYGRKFIDKRKRKRYQREQRDNLPVGFTVAPRPDGAMTPPEGHLVMTKGTNLPEFTPLPSPTRRGSLMGGEALPHYENINGAPTVFDSVDSLAHRNEKPSKLKAFRLKLNPGSSALSSSSKADPEKHDSSSGENVWLGKVKSVFKKEPDPEPDFWQSYNDRPKLKIVVDTPSDKSFSMEADDNKNKRLPLPPSRWSQLPPAAKYEFGWKSMSAKDPLDTPNESPKSASSTRSATPTKIPRRLPPTPPTPPGLRHKPSVPSDIRASYDDPFRNSMAPSTNDPNSIIPSMHPVPLHSSSEAFAATLPPPRHPALASSASLHPPSSSSDANQQHKRTSSVPVWRVTNFAPSDQVSLSSSGSITEEKTAQKGSGVRTLGVTKKEQQEVENPFITPFDDEHRVEIKRPASGVARKSMTANQFVNPGVAF